MKKFRRIVVAALAFVMAFGVTACGEKSNGGSNSVLIYEAPNTVKVMREADPMTESSTMTFEMAKNEYESAQLVFVPDKDVSSYDFTVADLTSAEGNRIDTGMMTVYHQKYIEVTKSSSSSAGMPTGWYPDALLPMETAAEYGETTVSAGENQSVWVKIKTSAETPAGLYTGTFTLTVDGKTYPVSASVTVWNFAVPEENHVKSSFYNFREYLINGELDNSMEMYEKYTDFLLDYRVSTDQLPVFEDDIDAYVEAAKKYAADPRCSAYNLYITGTSEYIPEINKSGPKVDIDRFEDYIRALVENSTPEVNLIEKLYIYWHALDEPHTEGSNRMAETKYNNEKMVDKLAEIADSYSEDQLAAYGVTADQIRYVEHVVTAPYYSEMEGVRTFCPLVNELDTEGRRELYRQKAYEAYGGGGTTWWYTACYPYSPYPNYHLDANLITARALSWMQRDYGVNGVLYWGTAVYVNVNDAQNRYPRDPYNDPEAFISAMGDGFLVYPGKRYGIDGPVPSIRLEAIRDGMEDYEYLLMLETLAGQYAEEFRAEGFDIDQILSELYDSIYYGTIADTDVSKLRDARREVAALIELLNSSSHAIILLDRIDPATEKAYITVYAAAGTTLEVEGTAINGAQSGSGLKFSYELALDEAANYFSASFTNGGETVTVEKFITNRVSSLTSMETDGEVSAWVPSVGSDAVEDGYDKEHITVTRSSEQVTDGDYSLKAVIAPYRGDDYENANYQPSLTAAASALWKDEKLSNLDTIEFDIYSDSDETITLLVYLQSGTRSKRVMSAEVKPGWNHITLSKVYEIDWKVGSTDMLDSADALSLRFPREDETTLTVYLDNFICSYKG